MYEYIILFAEGFCSEVLAQSRIILQNSWQSIYSYIQ